MYNHILYSLVISVVFSTLLYYYLHKKTKISLKFLYKDNIIVIILASLLSWLLAILIPDAYWFVIYILIFGFVVGLGFSITMIRFWRTPVRKTKAKENEIISPADGNVIYIKKVEEGETPVSIKGKSISKLEEITKTGLLKKPCWLIGINMTPFDVHKNCSPIDGEIVFNQHTPGKFLSLKSFESEIENERNTFIIENNKIKIGVVQIASKMVRRIDTYKTAGTKVKRGEWIGMIRFGSQVDILLPIEAKIKLKLKQQTYAGKTIIAEI